MPHRPIRLRPARISGVVAFLHALAAAAVTLGLGYAVASPAAPSLPALAVRLGVSAGPVAGLSIAALTGLLACHLAALTVKRAEPHRAAAQASLIVALLAPGIGIAALAPAAFASLCGSRPVAADRFASLLLYCGAALALLAGTSIVWTLLTGICCAGAAVLISAPSAVRKASRPAANDNSVLSLPIMTVHTAAGLPTAWSKADSTGG